MSILLASIIDTAVLLALGLLATRLVRSHSAALRHAVLTTFLLAAACAPAFERLLPHHPIVRWSNDVVTSSGLTLTSADDADTARATSEDSAQNGPAWGELLLMVWIAGMAITFASLLTSILRLNLLRRRSRPADERWQALAHDVAREYRIGTRVALLESSYPSMLVSCGLVRPAIILPPAAAAWSDERKRVVLRHELAHIARRDGAVQMLAEVLRVIHWFNPLVWVAGRRLRHDSECACDDAVLRAGVEPAEYATQLLAIARALCGRPSTFASAHAVAHPSTLERRIAAMLQTNRNRAPMTRRIWGVVALLVLAIAIPLTSAGVAEDDAITAVGESAPNDVALIREAGMAPAGAVKPVVAAPSRGQATGTLSGSVFDETGGALPGVRVTISEAASGKEQTQETNATGRFSFRDLAPSRYRLSARLPGFATHTSEVVLGAGAASARTITLPLGTIQETLNVACGAASVSAVSRLQRFIEPLLDGTFAVVSAQTPSSDPVRIGGNIRVPRKTRDVKPTCPPDAPAVDTTVRIRGRVGVDGSMHDVVALSNESGTEPPPAFLQSAVDAVRQWVFTPTLLNGQAVDVNITVDVHFRKP